MVNPIDPAILDILDRIDWRRMTTEHRPVTWADDRVVIRSKVAYDHRSLCPLEMAFDLAPGHYVHAPVTADVMEAIMRASDASSEGFDRQLRAEMLRRIADGTPARPDHTL